MLSITLNWIIIPINLKFHKLYLCEISFNLISQQHYFREKQQISGDKEKNLILKCLCAHVQCRMCCTTMVKSCSFSLIPRYFTLLS